MRGWVVDGGGSCKGKEKEIESGWMVEVGEFAAVGRGGGSRRRGDGGVRRVGDSGVYGGWWSHVWGTWVWNILVALGVGT